MNQIKVEINQFRSVDKGALRGFFNLTILPIGQKIIDCRYFEQGDKRWFSFPQKEVKYSDGRKSEYIPYVSFSNKEYLEQLKIAVINTISSQTQQGTNGKSASPAKQKNSLPSEPSSDWGEAPF